MAGEVQRRRARSTKVSMACAIGARAMARPLRHDLLLSAHATMAHHPLAPCLRHGQECMAHLETGVESTFMNPVAPWCLDVET
jgi:hypothetical protein